jgi:hypothetical protein
MDMESTEKECFVNLAVPWYPDIEPKIVLDVSVKLFFFNEIL